MRAHYTLVIGTRNWSSWSLRPYLALAATGAPFDTIKIALRTPESKAAIRKHSPSGKVPLLKIAEDGGEYAVWDSLAICETLAERHPEAGLLPEAPRPRALCRAVSAEMHAGFTNVRDQLSMDFARRLPLPELREETHAEIARILAIWQDALGAGDGGFLFGRFSIADCMYAPVVSRFITFGVQIPPAVTAYMARVMALPAMAEWAKASEREIADGLPDQWSMPAASQ
jgi:glutathione S-transferase